MAYSGHCVKHTNAYVVGSNPTHCKCLYSCGIEERAVYFSTESSKKRVVMFRYLLDTQRQVVLERDKGGGKRLKCRKAVRNAIVPKCERVRHSRSLYLLRWAIGSIKLIKENRTKKIKKC